MRDIRNQEAKNKNEYYVLYLKLCLPSHARSFIVVVVAQMSVEGQEAMQQMVQDAMAGMSGEGEAGMRGEVGVDAQSGGGGGGGGVVGGQGTMAGRRDFVRSASREQGEEEWVQRLAEAEDSMVSEAKVAFLLAP